MTDRSQTPEQAIAASPWDRIESLRYAQMRLWVRHWASDEQKARFATGLLPRAEFEQLVLPRIFAPLTGFALFKPITVDELRAVQLAAVGTPAACGEPPRGRFHEIAYQVHDASVEQIEAARALTERMQQAYPEQVGAMVIGHEAIFTEAGLRIGPTLIRYGLGITVKIGGWTLHREYALPH